MAGTNGKRSHRWAQQNNAADQLREAEASSPKRVLQINVKMSEQDYACLREAAVLLWPGAVLSNSGIVLGLAKIGANMTLKKPHARGT